MYTTSKKELVKCWGGFLATINWGHIINITYKFDIKPKRNERLMLQLQDSIQSNCTDPNIFWVMEHTSNNYQTHNHLLIRGEGVKDAVNTFLTSRNLVDPRFVQYIKYNPKLGAAHYVAKYIASKDVSYGIY